MVSKSSSFPAADALGVHIYAYFENIPSSILPGYDFTGKFQTDNTDCAITSVMAYSDAGAMTPVTQLTWYPSTNKIEVLDVNKQTELTYDFYLKTEVNGVASLVTPAKMKVECGQSSTTIITSTAINLAYILKEVFVDTVGIADSPTQLPIDLTWWTTTNPNCAITTAVM